MRLFGSATYFAIFLGGATYFCHLFGGATFLSSLILYGKILSSFEATTFLPFSGISYFRGEENFGLEFAKILS